MINFTRIGFTVVGLLGLSVPTLAQSLFSVEKVISGNANNAQKVFAADLDGDGDMDVLSASRDDNKIAWYENTDGEGSFGPQQVITNQAIEARSVYAADLDGDGDMDVLSASQEDSTVTWYENTDGQGSFGPKQVITGIVDGAVSAIAADLDDDGDLDVLAASFGSSPYWNNRIAWYENIDGQGSFGPEQVITTDVDGVESAIAADLDGDGDLDVLSASWRDDKIAWYENTDGQGSFGPQQVITTAADGALSVIAADLDGDGDMDVLSASWRDDKIAWYENTDGQGGFGPQQVISTPAPNFSFFTHTVFAADLDGDDDMDVLSASALDDEIAWYENSLIMDISIIPHKPENFSLYQNYPDPFNPDTSINFTVPKMSRVTLAIYDILGRNIRTLVSETKAAGSYNVTWNGEDNQGQQLASGLYFYKLQAGEFSVTKKMMLLK